MWNRLNENEAKEILAQKHFAHLGCVLDDSSPYVVPINYLLKDGAVYIHSLEGRKLEALRMNNNACIQVEDIKTPYKWRSVIAFGRFEEISDPEERSEALDDLLAQFSTLTPVEGVNSADVSAEELVVFRINIRKVTGVSEN